ncbi:MAG TPA: type II toxin-antitoxin system RelE/ParE family toxin [Rhodospirillaceae bacterium]|nr:type II toxin-antitoxin system RelE/ParE family toxin [Rhodospirillaceae bacterium]
MSVIWREEARNDISRITRYIAEENPIAARRIARELYLAGESLCVFPRRGRPGRVPGTRELIAVLPYLIIYEASASGDVEILNIWHGAQDRNG